MKKIIIIASLIIFLLSNAYCEEPLSLKQCIDLALKKNIEMINAKTLFKDSKLQKSLARSDFMPYIGAGLGYSHSEVGPSSQTYVDPITGIPRPVQPGVSKSTNYSSGFQLNQTIWDGGYTIANYQRRSFDEKASEYNLENTKQSVIYAVEESYIEMLRQQRLVEVYRETIKSSKEALKKAQSMETIGAAPHSDVLKAQVQYSQDRMSLIIAENSLANAIASLNYIVGFDVNRATEIQDIPYTEEIDLKYEDAVNISKENHPLIKQSAYSLKSADRYIRMAKSAYMPQLSGGASYSWYHEDFDKI